MSGDKATLGRSSNVNVRITVMGDLQASEATIYVWYLFQIFFRWHYIKKTGSFSRSGGLQAGVDYVTVSFTQHLVECSLVSRPIHSFSVLHACVSAYEIEWAWGRGYIIVCRDKQ